MEYQTTTSFPKIEKNDENNQEEMNDTLLIANLPKHTEIPSYELTLYQGSWHPSKAIPDIIKAQQCFQAQDTDIIIVSKPKCGTTWLKSLVYAIVHRTEFTKANHPLLTKNPHELVPYLFNHKAVELVHTSPRIFATHEPYEGLTKSVKETECKMVYITRNPFDALVSGWYFISSNVEEDGENGISLETYFDLFCRGMELCGPHWDHVLGHWKQSLETPNKVLFLMYEDLKENGITELKRLAKFIGCEFSLEEEKQGVIEEIFELSSLRNLKELEVIKTGVFEVSKEFNIDNKTFFRRGKSVIGLII